MLIKKFGVKIMYTQLYFFELHQKQKVCFFKTIKTVLELLSKVVHAITKKSKKIYKQGFYCYFKL